MSSTTTSAVTGRGDQESLNSINRAGSERSSFRSAANSQYSSQLAQHGLRFVVGRAGDHPLIHHLLVSVFRTPSSTEFHSQTEDPFYEPSDRLLIKQGDQIVGHVRLQNREMQFGPLLLPITIVTELVTLPEFRGQGVKACLLQEAEIRARQDGAVLLVTYTDEPKSLGELGWTMNGRHSYAECGPREVLAHLRMIESQRDSHLATLTSQQRKKPLNIRLWRHVEQAALIRLYEENASTLFGALRRSDDYWRWLVCRRAYDRIYVAIKGPNKLALDDTLSPIVGYAVMKDGRILELMTATGHQDVAPELVARACGDAIERDHHVVRFDGPPNHVLQTVFAGAGGNVSYRECDNGKAFMAKLFDPRQFVEQLTPLLHQRTKAAELNLPVELGLLVDDAKVRLVVGKRTARLEKGRLPRSVVKCSLSVFIQLLMGQHDVQALINAGRLSASTQVAARTASVLLPQLPLWFPPLDSLPAA